MIEILERKKMLLGEMMTLTEAQASAINADTLDRLQELVEEKQRRIDEIDKLDEEFEIYLDRLKKAYGIKRLDDPDAPAFPQAEKLKEVTGEILSLVSRISEAEKANNVKCRELLEQLGSQIKKINQGKKINNAYNTPPPGVSSFFVDKKR
ncbi:MAG: flagellar protein FlgN [Bacillota bacterium]